MMMIHWKHVQLAAETDMYDYRPAAIERRAAWLPIGECAPDCVSLTTIPVELR